jgi:Uma2 family endonuclease
MATPTVEQLMTAEELERMPDDGSALYELDHGRLIRLNLSWARHALTSANTTFEMSRFVKHHALGLCFPANTGFQLTTNPDTVRAPKASFVSAKRIPKDGIPRRGYWPGAPDLAVEVPSPTNPPGEMWRRIGDLLNAGTRLIWVIDPERRTALIIHPGGETQLHGEEYTLDGEDVVPGFLLPLHDVLA